MSQTSTLFLRNFTAIDHAFITEAGHVMGYSYHPEGIVSGDVDPIEQVVVDFSSIKKQMKAIIDSKEDGFDHKLWLIEGWSDYSIIDNGNSYTIVTPYSILNVAKNAVKIIPWDGGDFVSCIESAMEKQIEHKLRKINSNDSITVTITLDTNYFSESTHSFTYWHGLKHSTSWGCQNIAHGHLSFVEVYAFSGKRLNHLEDMIASYLDGAMLCNRNDVDNDSRLSYTTERGDFSVEWNDENEFKVIYMNVDTTVENIVEHVLEKYKKVLVSSGASQVYISEGLQKGAVLQVKP